MASWNGTVVSRRILPSIVIVGLLGGMSADRTLSSFFSFPCSPTPPGVL